MSHGNKQQWILAKRPQDVPDPSEVVFQEVAIPDTAAGMVLVKNHYISLDPAIRLWMSDIPNYLPPIPIGDPIRATGGSNGVANRNGWQIVGNIRHPETDRWIE